MDFYHTARAQLVGGGGALRCWDSGGEAVGRREVAQAQSRGGRAIVQTFKRLKLQEAEAQGVRQAAVSYLEGHQAGMHSMTSIKRPGCRSGQARSRAVVSTWSRRGANKRGCGGQRKG